MIKMLNAKLNPKLKCQKIFDCLLKEGILSFEIHLTFEI